MPTMVSAVAGSPGPLETNTPSGLYAVMSAYGVLAGTTMVRDVAFGGFKCVGQKCDFEQYARNAEEDEAEECGKKATEIV